MKKRILSAVLALILVTLSLFLVFPRPKEEEAIYTRYSYMFFGTFDTAITLIGFTRTAEKFDSMTKLAEELFNEYHRQFNQYLPYEGLNNLYYLNRNAADGPVPVPQELFDLISYCKKMQGMTMGTVNIALGSVLSLWHDERENAEVNPDKAKLPDLAALQEAAKHTNMDDVILDEASRTVYYRDPLLKLDVGAIAKGYATELVAKALAGAGMPSYILNAGGNVRTGSVPMDGRKNWGIAVQDPDAEIVSPGSSEVLEVFYLHDMSVVTSGDYQRYFMVDGKRYHHLINPETLMPADFMRSVTIITRDSGYADLLSTAVFLMPYEKGRAFVESLEGVDAFWMLNDGSLHMTEGVAGAARSRGATAE
jgi:thiamine biosynthesis lipoprotein